MKAILGQWKLSVSSPRSHILIPLVRVSGHTRQTLTSASFNALLLRTVHSNGPGLQVRETFTLGSYWRGDL